MSLDSTNATDLIILSTMLDEVSETVNQFNATKIEMIKDKIRKIILSEGHDINDLIVGCKKK
jgi:hypothetical protein